MRKRLFAVVLILSLSLGILAVFDIKVFAADLNMTLSDYELATKFVEKWGPATVQIADISGVGVRFNFTGLTNPGATAMGDGYPVDALAGGALDVVGQNGNFSNYTHFRLQFKNVGTSDVNVGLFMNTGFTDPPYGQAANDTFWQGDWTFVGAGQTVTATLDFSSAICYNAYDDPIVAWQHPDPTSGVVVRRLDEVTKIGFQILGTGAGLVVVSGYASGTTKLYISPSLVHKERGEVDSVFEVAVKIEEITDLYGFDLKISWDNTLLSFNHVDYDTSGTSPLKFMWGPTAGQNYSAAVHDAGANYYRLVAFSLRNGFTGSHTILILGFKVLDPQTNSKKQTTLHFEAAFDKLSDSNAQAITHTTTDGAYEIWGGAPTLDLTHAAGHSRTCRKINEEFIVTVSISDAVNLAGCDFEIDFDTSMINGVSYTIDWGTGSITFDETGGKVTGTLTGSGTGSFTLATIRFKSDPSFQRFWKDPSTGQSSNLFPSATGIYFQSITLHYTSLPDITYTKGGGGGGRIYVGPDFAYTYAPIRGDLNNDGKVDITDLTSIAGVFDTTNPAMNLVGSTSLIDIFDLVVVAGNFWYEYTPPAP
jgi:hypothetical protein